MAFGQVVATDHKVRKQQTEYRIDHPQQAVAEIGLLPWLNGEAIGLKLAHAPVHRDFHAQYE